MPSQVTSSSPDAGARGSRWSWLLPAGTFLAGCLLGGVVIGVGEVGSDDGPSPSASQAAADEGTDGPAEDGAADETDDGSADGDGDGDVTVRVPEACVQAAEEASELVESVDRVVAAVADLDPRQLRRTVDDVQQVRDDVQDVAEQCRDIAAERSSGSSGTDEDAAPATPSS